MKDIIVGRQFVKKRGFCSTQLALEQQKKSYALSHISKHIEIST